MRLDELKRCAYVLKAASVAWQTLIHGTERWFCEPDGIVDGIRE